MKREGELPRRLVAPLGVLGHRNREDALELRGHVAAADGGHRGAQHAVEYGELAVVSPGNLEGGVACEDTVHGGGQGIDVDGGTEGTRAVLLLRRCPRHGETARGFLARSRLRGDAEVSEDGVPKLGEQDVHGLDVAVDDPALVERLHCARDAHADVKRLGHGDAVFFGTLAQVRGRTVLHDQVVAAVVRNSPRVEGHDGRVVGDLSHQVHFGVKGRRGPGVGIRTQDLDRHVALGHLLAEQVDVGETARAEVADERCARNCRGIEWLSHYASIRNEMFSPSSTTSPGVRTMATDPSRRTGACPGRISRVPFWEPRSWSRTSQSSIRSSQ